MPRQKSVVLASNRGPVGFRRSNGGLTTAKPAGGLAAAVDPVARALGEEALWIAATTSDAERAAAAERADEALFDELGYELRLLDIAPDTYEQYYEVVSNRMLWFANHCLFEEVGLTGFTDDEVRAWNAYEEVNERFAEAIAAAAAPDGLVLIQDYHLTTAPRRLRVHGGDQTVLHFTHSAFCGPDGLRLLPQEIGRAVVEGMLAADIVGFHVRPWADAFLDVAEGAGHRVDHVAGEVETGRGTCWIRTYPIPIDAADLVERAQTAPVRAWVEQIRRSEDDIIIARADRIEPAKNIVRGFDAFAALLDTRADLRGRTRFVASLYGSRESMPEYRRYRAEVERAAARVNERYPGSVALYLEDDFDRTVAAFVTYDVLLVNSLMDGMNLVAKEGASVNERWGSLVLSRRAGSFAELAAWVTPLDDPTDVQATAAAIEQALLVSAHERRRRALRLRQLVHTHTPDEWIDEQLADLRAVRDAGRPKTDL